MRILKKRLLLVLSSLAVVFSILFFALNKSTIINIESKLGKFCLECKAYQSGNGTSAYGFGLAYCDNKINKMSNAIKYNEIDKYKLHLNDRGFVKIMNLVSEIEYNLKSNNAKKYVYSVREYTKEINDLNIRQKEDVLSFFKK